MKVTKLSEMKRGWFIGDFEPSVLKTKDFEVSIMFHPKEEKWQKHYHAISTEYNVLIKGSMNCCGQELNEGDIFIIYPNEIVDPIFHDDCTIVCVKVPSITNDKYIL